VRSHTCTSGPSTGSGPEAPARNPLKQAALTQQPGPMPIHLAAAQCFGDAPRGKQGAPSSPPSSRCVPRKGVRLPGKAGRPPPAAACRERACVSQGKQGAPLPPRAASCRERACVSRSLFPVLGTDLEGNPLPGAKFLVDSLKVYFIPGRTSEGGDGGGAAARRSAKRDSGAHGAC
jgi:hypothetical protein